MGRKRAGRAGKDQGSGPTAGTYGVDSGEVELVPDANRANGWWLYLDGRPSSHVVIGDPMHLEFAYMRWIAAAIEWFAPAFLDLECLRITHLGAAGCSLPRWAAACFPRSRNTAVEIDAQLAAHVREWFDIPRSPSVKIRAADALEVLEEARPASRDIVIRDVFANGKTPSPLADAGFFREVARTLAPGGLYAANVGDDGSLDASRAEVREAKRKFASVALITDRAMLRPRRKHSGNVVVVASDRPLPREGTPDAARISAGLLGGESPAVYCDPAWVAEAFTA